MRQSGNAATRHYIYTGTQQAPPTYTHARETPICELQQCLKMVRVRVYVCMCVSACNVSGWGKALQIWPHEMGLRMRVASSGLHFAAQSD